MLQNLENATKAVLDRLIVQDNLKARHMRSAQADIIEKAKKLTAQELWKALEEDVRTQRKALKRNDGIEFDDVRSREWLRGVLSVYEAALIAVENSL